MTGKEQYHHMVQVLGPRYGFEEAAAMAVTAMRSVLNMDTAHLMLTRDDELTPYRQRTLDDITSRLMASEPLQYILGDTEWMGMRLKVTPQVLIPRPETAMLVDTIVDDARGRADLRVLDVGTGSGCIALALARALRFPQVTALDISEGALDVARDNARALAVRNVTFLHADILSAVPAPESLDIVVSNPPYVLDSERAAMDANVLEHEPHTALFVPDADPLRFYNAIAAYAAVALVDEGMLYYECNPLTVNALADTLRSHGWQEVTTMRDDAGRQRFLKARKWAR